MWLIGWSHPGAAASDSAAGGGLATAALRSRFGGWRLGGRRLGGGGGGLATAAPRSQLGVYLSFSLSFSLSRGLSVLIRGHIQDLCCVDNHSCTKCSVYIYLLCDSIPIRTGPCSLAPMQKKDSLSHSLSELIGEQYTTRLFDKLKLAYLVRV